MALSCAQFKLSQSFKLKKKKGSQISAKLCIFIEVSQFEIGAAVFLEKVETAK